MATQLTSNGILFNDNTEQITKTTRQGRNRIINGAMEVDQRRNGLVSAANTTLPEYLSIDRYISQGSVSGKFVIQQNLNAVTPPLGVSKYLGFKTTAAYTLITSSLFVFAQNIEGIFIGDLAWGSSSAKSITISFWARSSLTGMFSGSIRNGPLTHSYNFTYELPDANTWTKIIVTIPGPTFGVWYLDNNIGIRVSFNMGTGATYSTSNTNVWEAVGNKFGVNGVVSVISTLNATFFITGLQLEEGTVATEFERIPYDEELLKCQRYYQIVYANTRGYCNATTNVVLTNPIQYYNTMRNTPTVVITTGSRSPNMNVVSVVANATMAAHRVQAASAGDTYALVEKCEFNAEIAEVSSFTIASGGTETTYAADGFTYKVHTFLTSATFTVTQAGRSTGDLDVLIVAGGGGGGATGSGGGAGGMIATKMYLPATGAYSITVGAGGAGGIAPTGQGGNGINSVFGELIAVGGGGGVSHHIGNGIAGGSGGGGSIMPTTSGSYPGGAGTAGQGNAGGAGFAAGGSWPGCSGGGGGAGEAGIAGGNSAGNGRGGNGLQNNYRTGSAVYYAGGGGGGEVNGAVAGAGGLGGGGSAVIDGAGGAGTNGLGGGGAGGSYNGNYFNGGAGGSGIVVIRYRTA